MWRATSRALAALAALLLVALITVGCHGSPAAGDKPVRERLVVAAAANLKFAFDELEAAFERQHPESDLVVTYGSSGQFFSQLCQQAAFDIFFSADTRYPLELVERGFAIPENYFLYASGRIVVWVPGGSPLNLEALKGQAVIAPSVRKIAMANPRLAPYGAAAEEALQALGVYEQVKDKLVLGENITQTAAFVESGAADLGILALSLARAPGMKERGTYWEIPADTHSAIDQAAVIPRHSQNPRAANQLRAFFLSASGQAILKKYGYTPPPADHRALPTVRHARPTARPALDWSAIWLTLKLATCTTATLFIVGLPLAYWLATTRWRGGFLMESLMALPLVLPPTVLGFYILLATGPQSMFGQAYDRVTGSHLPFTFPGILLGSVLYNFPFAVRPFAAAFQRLDTKLLEASWCLGESKWRTFWRVMFPLSWPGILAGMVLTFAHSVGEFGVVLMVGGNIPGVTRTLSIAIYDDVQALDYASASQTALLLVIFSLVILAIAQGLSKRGVSA